MQTNNLLYRIALPLIALSLALSAPQPNPQEGDKMAVRQLEWVQNQWLQAKVDLYHNRGDFYDAQALYPDIHSEALRRTPAWSAHVDLPAGIVREGRDHEGSWSHQLGSAGRPASVDLLQPRDGEPLW